MKNLTQNDIRFIDSSGVIVLILNRPSESPAKVVCGGGAPAYYTTDVHGRSIPTAAHTTATAVRGLPEDDGEPILVPPAIVDAMRALGIRRRGGVFSPMPTSYSAERVPLGVPGLIEHKDLRGG